MLLEGPGTYQGMTKNAGKEKHTRKRSCKKKKEMMRKSRSFLNTEQDILKHLSSDEEIIPPTPQKKGRKSCAAPRIVECPGPQKVTTPRRKGKIYL